MPIYYFDLLKGNEIIEDDQGQDLADIEVAKLEGLASARELIADAAKKGILATSPVFRIRNEFWRRPRHDPLQGHPQTGLRRVQLSDGNYPHTHAAGWRFGRADHRRHRVEAERRQVTVLFTDMVGFTTFSERSGGRHNPL